MQGARGGAGQRATLRVRLAGDAVVVVANPNGQVRSALAEVGVSLSHTGHGEAFAGRMVGRLARLPGNVAVAPSDGLRAIVRLVCNPPSAEQPAHLDVDASGCLSLSWFDGNIDWFERVPDDACGLLSVADLPFVATDKAWRRLSEGSLLPLLVGRAKMNLDGFIELSTSRPEELERAALPGLFRIGGRKYGLALRYAPAVDADERIAWVGPRPTVERAGGAARRPLPLPLSPHQQSALPAFVDRLTGYGAQVVAWPSGWGRRIFALAAVWLLDAWPLTVVAPPSGMLVWDHHCRLFGVPPARMTGAPPAGCPDVLIADYPALLQGRYDREAVAVIADAPFVDEARLDRVRKGFGGLSGSYRIAVHDRWPQDPAAALGVLGLLRPVEFDPSARLQWRYPEPSEGRAREHAAAYLTPQPEAAGMDPPSVRVGTVRVPLVEPVAAALQAAAGIPDPVKRLAAYEQLVAAGTDSAPSGKVAATRRITDAQRQAGRTVAVLTRNPQAAQRIQMTLGGTAAVQCWEHPDGLSVAADTLLLVEPPRNADVIQRLLADGRVRRLVILHSPGSVDDRIAARAVDRDLPWGVWPAQAADELAG